MPIKLNLKEAAFSQLLNQHPEIQKMIVEGYKSYTHIYRDADGKEIYRKVRYKNYTLDQKWIRSSCWDGTNWLWKEPELPNGKPPYMLNELVKHTDATLIFQEGEQKVDVLNEFLKTNGMYGKYVATTTGSSTSTASADLKCVKGRSIIVWRDNDPSGVKYAKNITEALQAYGCTVTWVDIEKLNLPEKGSDAVNFFNAHPKDALKHFMQLLADVVIPTLNDPAEPLFALADAKVGKYMKGAPPPRRWVLYNCLPLGKTVLLVGPGGVGKSRFTMQLLVDTALGRPFCGHWPIGEVGATLALYSEDEDSELNRRFYEITEGLTHQQKKLVADRVHMKSMVGMCNQFTEKVGSEVQTLDYIDRLIVLAKQIPNLKLIIIDPASRFRGGDENNSSDTTRFVEACEFVAQATGATVMIVHHVNKGSMNDSDSSQAASRGSSALTDGVRWQMNLGPMSTAKAKSFDIMEEDRRFYVKASVTKNNYAPPQAEEVWLKLSDTGVLEYQALTTGSDSKNDSRIANIVQKVAEEAAKGIEYSKSGFAKEYGSTEGIFSIGNQGLRGLLEVAILKNQLVLAPPKIPKQNLHTVLAVAGTIKEVSTHSDPGYDSVL